ncbi:Hypothetical protein CAP_7900 [Chondromyces apiculatus DSM 436]|uniref:Uncharacterized protein n=1 Tax=Chondromyces apiculatus DSM 436 TaxID=1192034 RepID=A0A017SYJ9_9BACT|nr:Hypothetical protein CAP_7900 [Chondromyces apiculatus DSM 436]
MTKHEGLRPPERQALRRAIPAPRGSSPAADHAPRPTRRYRNR